MSRLIGSAEYWFQYAQERHRRLLHEAERERAAAKSEPMRPAGTGGFRRLRVLRRWLLRRPADA